MFPDNVGPGQNELKGDSRLSECTMTENMEHEEKGMSMTCIVNLGTIVYMSFALPMNP